MEGLRSTKIKGFYEFTRQPCPICHKTGGCMIHEKGNMVVCIRTESEKIFSTNFQSWIHLLDKGVKVDAKKNNVSNRQKLPDEALDYVNSRILKDQYTNIISAHCQHFVEQRGMSLEQVAIRGYRSAPYSSTAMAKNCLGPLAERLNNSNTDLGMPGFYVNRQGEWDFVAKGGILIPYRNAYNEILGFQVRQDEVKYDISYESQECETIKADLKQRTVTLYDTETGEVLVSKELEIGEILSYTKENQSFAVKLKKGNRYVWVSSPNHKYGAGVGSPMPVHVAVPSVKLAAWNKEVESKKANNEEITPLKAETVWLTEGALKADIAVDHIARAFDVNEVGDTMLAVAGINSWRTILPVLFQMGVKRVNIAFDMDAITNPYVRQAYEALLKELPEAGYEVHVALWNIRSGKGIDDILCKKVIPVLKKYC